MDDLNGRPILVTLLTTHRDYSARTDTDTSYGRYDAVLRPNHIEMEKPAAAIVPQEFAPKIYAAAKESVTTN